MNEQEKHEAALSIIHKHTEAIIQAGHEEDTANLVAYKIARECVDKIKSCNDCKHGPRNRWIFPCAECCPKCNSYWEARE